MGLKSAPRLPKRNNKAANARKTDAELAKIAKVNRDTMRKARKIVKVDPKGAKVVGIGFG